MKVLVTGSSGWLGRVLIPLLKAAGHEPVGLDVVPSPWTAIEGSVADAPAVQAAFAEYEFDGVMHAGALHKPDIVRYPQQAFIDVNVTGTLNLLEAASARPGTRFVFTSTTSLMITQQIKDERTERAVWFDEETSPIEPRNIYGVTKLAAEALCRQHALQRGLSLVVLRTSRFFPEDDDTDRQFDGANLKSNELLHRRATVHDMARAHLTALEQAHDVGFGLYLVSAPTPFLRDHLDRLKTDATALIEELHPGAGELYAGAGWQLPTSLGRVYDGSRITRELGFAYQTRFADVLEALAEGRPSPVEHDPSYTSPLWESR
ncbi:MAG: NAD(P)-dependent oxidoreductase, partial [Acidobacteriota bacterium]